MDAYRHFWPAWITHGFSLACEAAVRTSTRFVLIVPFGYVNLVPISANCLLILNLVAEDEKKMIVADRRGRVCGLDLDMKHIFLHCAAASSLANWIIAWIIACKSTEVFKTVNYHKPEHTCNRIEDLLGQGDIYRVALTSAVTALTRQSSYAHVVFGTL